jgi:putative ABC transport system substrate-binding protein
MNRRDFITLLGSAAAWPLTAKAQQFDGMKRVGVLMNGDEADPAWRALLSAFVQGLRGLGWIEGQNLRSLTLWPNFDSERSRAFAADLLRFSPDVIFSAGTANLTALLRQAPPMPIVFVQVSDPVAQGFVSNLAHPEGNITGLSSYEFPIGSKWVDLLKQMAPTLARVSLVFNPDTAPQSKFLLASMEAAAPALGVEIMGAPIHDAADIERAVTDLSRLPNGGLIVANDNFLTAQRQLVVELAARYRVPAIYPSRLYPQIGGLMSYGVDNESQSRQAAIYVDRILRGTKPGSLPVQGPSKFSFVVNVKAARALGIEIPMSLLFNADDYIE